MKQQHTPGPWTYGIRQNKTIWLSLGDPRSETHYQGDLVASSADARLIAAAPDLLEALKDMLREGSQSYLDRVSCNARAAIAKAEEAA